MTVPALTPAQLSAFRLLLHDVRRVAGVDLVVGTFMDTGADYYVVDQLVGVTSDGLRNLRVTVGAGLGGKAMLLTRPVLVQDYCTAEGITHDYDAAVRREGVAASFAVPIRVPAGPRGVLVGGLRHEHVFGDSGGGSSASARNWCRSRPRWRTGHSGGRSRPSSCA